MHRALPTITVAAVVLASGCTEHTIFAPSPDFPVALAYIEQVNEVGISEWVTHARVPHGESVEIDGTQSYDPNKPDHSYSRLTFEWQFQITPPGSAAQLEFPFTLPDSSEPDLARPVLSPDVDGTYRLGLRVTEPEDELTSEWVYVTVQSTAWENLVVDLYWDVPATDVDLHLLAPHGEYWTETDCYYGNPNPDWGIEGASIDDPLYGEDDDNGGDETNPAQEQVAIQGPAEGTYTVVVSYHSDRETDQTVSPWVEVTMAGQQLGDRMDAPQALEEHQVWIVAEIEMPELEVTVVDEITDHETLGGPPVNE